MQALRARQRQALGGDEPDHFLARPESDRLRQLQKVLIKPGLIWQLDDQPENDSLPGLILLHPLDDDFTNPLVVQAREVYYTENYFSVSAPFLGELLDDTAKRSMTKVSVFISVSIWRDFGPGAAARWLAQLLACEHLQQLVISIQGRSASDKPYIVNILDEISAVLCDIAAKFQDGVVVVERDCDWNRAGQAMAAEEVTGPWITHRVSHSRVSSAWHRRRYEDSQWRAEQGL